MTKDLVVIAHNIRSTHNIGSIIRTCDGLGVTKLYITGYSPHPQHDNDSRLPHISRKIGDQIAKTSLGAEFTMQWEYQPDCHQTIDMLKNQGYEIVALEQSNSSTPLPDFKMRSKIALLLGEEVHGIASELLNKCDDVIEIPMYGQKESFNVSVAAAIALYHLRFYA